MDALDKLFAWAGREHDIAITQHATSKELGNYQQAARHESYASAMRKVQSKIVQLTINMETKITDGNDVAIIQDASNRANQRK